MVNINEKQPILILLVGLFIVIILFFYFKIFLTKGAYFEGTFLKKEVINSEHHYKGKDRYGDIHITVKKQNNNPIEVIYNLPNNIKRHYIVNFEKSREWDFDNVNITDEKGNIVFEGKYKEDSYFLYDKDGRPIIENTIKVVVGGSSFYEKNNPYNESYTVSVKNIVDMATFSNDKIRGQLKYLLMAVIIFIFVAIDIKFPLFFFRLKYVLSVKDPEPSDLYIAVQRIGWVICLVTGVGLMVASIYV